MNQLKEIIFDLDSTLVDVDLNFDLIRSSLGIPEKQPILEYLETLQDNEKKDHLHKELLSFELEAARNSIILEGAKECLSFLKGFNLNLAILTRNCEQAAQIELEEIKDFFFPIYTRESNKVCKPQPDGVHNICKLWKVKPEEVIVIGDYLFDLLAGKRAGTKTLWFNNPKYKERDFSREADGSFSSWIYFQENFEQILNQLELGLKPI